MGEETAPSIDDEHRANVRPVAQGEAFAGFVTLEAQTSGLHMIFVNAHVPLTVTETGGLTIPPDHGHVGRSLCDAVKAPLVLPLEVGTCHLSIGPTAEETISIVVLAQRGHATADETMEHTHHL